MMNFKIGALRTIQGEIGLLINFANHNAAHVASFPGGHKNTSLADDPKYQDIVNEAREWATSTAEMAGHRLAYLSCPHIDHAVKSLTSWTKQGNPDFSHLRAKAIALRDAIDTELSQHFYYQYPKEKARQVNAYEDDWKAAIASFPAVKTEIFCAIDCYGLGHNIACVFHLMRVMEIGVQRFGKKLRVSLVQKKPDKLTDKTWHQILNDLNPQLNKISQTTTQGKEKHEKYSAIQSYLYRVKDAWRNPTMHPRKTGYNDLETQNIINQVRSFMNELASVIPPPTPKPPTKTMIPTRSIASLRP